eukprot:gene30479-36838_t
MMASALTIKKPHPNFTIDAAPTDSSKAQAVATPPAAVPDYSIEEVMRDERFYQLGVALSCMAMGGFGLFAVAKPMMSEIFSSNLPLIVTSAFASKYVMALSGGNLGGRLGWAAVSDLFGRRNTFTFLTLCSMPVYLVLPTLVDTVISTGEALPLYAFCGMTVLAVSAVGGAFSVLPAYEAELFGPKYVSAIHGRILLFSSFASVAGPSLLMKLRSISEQKAIDDLLSKISPDAFLQAFGAPMEKANELLATKTITISKLLTVCPPGTLDPSPHLYDSTMYTLGGLMVVAMLSHSMVKPTIVVPAKEAKIVEEKVIATEETSGDREIKK